MKKLSQSQEKALERQVDEAAFIAKQNDGARYIVTVRLVYDDEAKSLESAYFWS